MPVDIRGKEYFTVAERLKLAYGDVEPPKGVQSVETAVMEVGGIVVVKATVTFHDGRHFSGSSMVKSASSSPAERDAPLETCETSAVGRALAFAGYFGNPEGIAGAEELSLAQQRAEERADRRAEGVGTAAPRPVRYGDGSTDTTRAPAAPGTSSRLGGAGKATERQIGYAEKLLKDKGMPPPSDLTTMSSQEVSALIDRLRS